MNRILIVEDEKNLARFIELELQHENYETAVANDGRAGLELALNEEWDAILLDLMLPHLNGVRSLSSCAPSETNTHYYDNRT